MKKTIIAAILLMSAIASAEPLKVSRTEADVYTATDGTVVATEGCTVSARKMTAVVEWNRGRAFVVFYDQHGEEEADCVARSVVKTRNEIRVAKR